MDDAAIRAILELIKEGFFSGVFIALYIMERRSHMETLSKFIDALREREIRREARNSWNDEPPTRRRPSVGIEGE